MNQRIITDPRVPPGVILIVDPEPERVVWSIQGIGEIVVDRTGHRIVGMIVNTNLRET